MQASRSLLHKLTGSSNYLASDISLLKRVLVHRRYRAYNKIPFEEKWKGINAVLASLGKVSQGNVLNTFYDAGDSFRAMWAAVDEAQSKVKWQTYICKDDNVGRVTVKKLETAHDRGVNVELLYDCGGNITGRTRLTRGLRKRGSGAKVIVYRPFFIAMWDYISGGMHWQDSPSLRNHRKILVVDEKIAFVGGINIGDDYCSKSAGGNGRFRDTQCRVVGPAVTHISQVYDDTKLPQHQKWMPWRAVIKARVRCGLIGMRDSVNRSNYIIKEAFTDLREATQIKYHLKMPEANAMMRKVPLSFSQLRITSRKYVEGSETERREMRRVFKDKIKSRAHFTKAERQVLAHMIRERACFYKSIAFNRIIHSAQACIDAAKNEVEATTSEYINYGSKTEDSAPIPEVDVFKCEPPKMQIMACNPLTLDWTIPMAMYFVVKHAHRRVWVTTPYYLPHRKLTAAIITAARRGVDVRIIAGSRYTTDPWFMWYASQYITMRFLQAGVRVYEFNGDQIMHAKTVVVDSVWCSIGSYNWDVLSNKLMEVCVTNFGTEEAAVLEDHFRTDLAKSKEITIKFFGRRSLFKKLQCAFFYYGMRFGEKIGFWNYWDKHLSTSVDIKDRG